MEEPLPSTEEQAVRATPTLTRVATLEDTTLTPLSNPKSPSPFRPYEEDGGAFEDLAWQSQDPVWTFPHNEVDSSQDSLAHVLSGAFPTTQDSDAMNVPDAEITASGSPSRDSNISSMQSTTCCASLRALLTQPLEPQPERASNSSGLAPTQTTSHAESPKSTLGPVRPLMQTSNSHPMRTMNYKPQHKAQKKPVTALREYLTGHKILEYNDWLELVRTDPEASKLHVQTCSITGIRRTIHNVICANRELVPHTSYKERIRIFNCVGFDHKRSPLYNTYFTLITQAGYDMREIFKVLCGEYGKKKTVLFVGPADSGKTAMITLLTSMYPTWQKGVATPQDIKSPFWMEDFVNKEVKIFEEAYCTEANVDALKLCMEGNPTLKTQVKNEGKVYLPPTPVLMASNTTPWTAMPAAYGPIRARCYYKNLCAFQMPKKTLSGGPMTWTEEFPDELKCVLKTLFLQNADY